MATNRTLEDASNRLDRLSKETEEICNRLIKSGKLIDRAPSGAVVAGFGAAIGATLSVFVSFYLGIPLPPLMAALSALGGLGLSLALRGGARFKLDSANSRNRAILDESLSQISTLPDDAPAEIRAQYWERHSRLLAESQVSTLPLIAGRKPKVIEAEIIEERHNLTHKMSPE